jgi:L-alanine-DL-glutamate epimerase-like enolase superfamily enzyme
LRTGRAQKIDFFTAVNRRQFVFRALAGLSVAAFPARLRAGAPRRELRITRILVQAAQGRRLTPVAPNAYAAYRGYDRAEPLLRIQTAQGIEGIGRPVAAELLQRLVGLDPFRLFNWTPDGRISGAADDYAELIGKLGGADIALLDLLGKAMDQPIAALLGASLRDRVPIYNSCVYMEDLLTPEQCAGLAYLKGSPIPDPVERVARKAAWVMEQPEGFRALKIKLGRSKWMPSAHAADERDIAVTHAVRRAIGPDALLYVDGNRDYSSRPTAVAAYAEAVHEARIGFLEEMIREENIEDLRALRLALRTSGNPVKLASGESAPGGIAEKVLTQRVSVAGEWQPLIDVEQADMNRNGLLFLRAKAERELPLGMTMAPHNFGSKLGFYAQIHLGTVVPNWETSEIDDVVFPALHGDGFVLRNGAAQLAGMPGLGIRLDESRLDAPTVDLQNV